MKLVCQFVWLALLAQGQTRVEIRTPEVRAHRISRVDWLRVPGAEIFQSVVLRMEVDAAGAVTSVKAIDGPEKFQRDAVGLAKTWRYRPFVSEGRAVPAAFTDYVGILPPERPVSASVLFPAVRDWTSVRITLKRTTCFGPCPAYEVQIDGNGDVRFKGREGDRRRHISRDKVENLLEVFRKADYFSLERDYRIEVTDLPTYITSISIDGQTMTVLDYGGLEGGMPVSVRDVEEAIDEAAGTRDWLEPVR